LLESDDYIKPSYSYFSSIFLVFSADAYLSTSFTKWSTYSTAFLLFYVLCWLYL